MPLEEEIVTLALSRSEDSSVRRAIQLWNAIKFGGLFTFLGLFSALGAYVQFEWGNIGLMVMYIVLGPVAFILGLLGLRRAFVLWRHKPEVPNSDKLDRGSENNKRTKRGHH